MASLAKSRLDHMSDRSRWRPLPPGSTGRAEILCLPKLLEAGQCFRHLQHLFSRRKARKVWAKKACARTKTRFPEKKQRRRWTFQIIRCRRCNGPPQGTKTTQCRHIYIYIYGIHGVFGNELIGTGNVPQLSLFRSIGARVIPSRQVLLGGGEHCTHQG